MPIYLYIRPAIENITKKRTPKKENNTRSEKHFCSQQMYFAVNNDNEMALECIDLRSSVVRRFSKSKQLPGDSQVRPKHVEIDCDFNVVLN
jgi:hypothetical protein